MIYRGEKKEEGRGRRGEQIGKERGREREEMRD